MEYYQGVTNEVAVLSLSMAYVLLFQQQVAADMIKACFVRLIHFRSSGGQFQRRSEVSLW